MSTTEKKQTAKETMIEIVRAEGYDYFTAAEYVTEAIKEFLASGKKEQRYYIGKSAFVLRNDRL